MGVPFDVVASQASEELDPEETAPAAASRLARAKAQQVFAHVNGGNILAADTLVFGLGEIFGKPRDDADAARMLDSLSGKLHSVTTALCLLTPDRKLERSSVSQVRFAPLSPQEIRWYVESGEPRDKAGAYAIQGLGARFIREIRGSFSNVVGLPAREVYEMLLEAGLSDLALP